MGFKRLGCDVFAALFGLLCFFDNAVQILQGRFSYWNEEISSFLTFRGLRVSFSRFQNQPSIIRSMYGL